MPTFTAIGARPIDVLRGHHVGLQHVTCVVSMTALLSAGGSFRVSGTGATLIMGRVPIGARIVGMQYGMQLGGDNDVTFKIGYPGSLSAFQGGASFTGQAGIAWTNTDNMPYNVTASDDAMPRWRNIVMTMVTPTSLTEVGVLSLTTFFTNDLV